MLLATAASFCIASDAEADMGEPVSITFRDADDDAQSAVVEITSMGGLSIALFPKEISGKLKPSSALRISATQTLQHCLHRQANSNQVIWSVLSGKNPQPPAAFASITVRSVYAGSAPQPKQTPIAACVSVDGIHVLMISEDLSEAIHMRPPFELPKHFDAIVFSKPLTKKQLAGTAARIKGLNPSVCVVRESEDQGMVKEFSRLINANNEPQFQGHNRIAIAAATESNESSGQTTSRVVALTTQPWQMSAELTGLFTKMEASCENSQNVFSKLTTEQLNFRPANGTHTPRWNAEHMMGRQLGFISQIYHAIDPTIPHMNKNPKQMPPDYIAAHADWDGKEEARQMQRVSEFSRRFAYLLQDVPFDERAPGSGWTLRKLLLQMDRHYGEHTANTVKKFELPGWPKGNATQPSKELEAAGAKR